MCRKWKSGILFVVVFGLALHSSVARSQEAGLVGYWKFDESSGGVAEDSAGGDNNGVLANGISFQPGAGRSGGALFVEPADSLGYCQVPTVGMNPSAGTVMLWINLPDGQPARSRYFVGHTGETNGSFTNRVQLRSGEATGGDVLSLGLGATRNLNANVMRLATETWYHVVATWDNGTYFVYVNGQQMATGSYTGLTKFQPAMDIGNDGNTGGSRAEAFAGRIDEARFYDRALGAAEILGAMKGTPYPLASGASPKDGSLELSTWVTLSWSPGDFAVSHDVYIGDNFEDVNNGAAGTFWANLATPSLFVGFPGYPYPDGLVPGTTYYWRVDEVNQANPNSPWKGNVWSFSIAPHTAYAPVPADGAGAVAVNATISWTPGYGAKLHTVYFGDKFDDVNNATSGTMSGSTTYNPGPLQRQKVYYWRVDEFDGVTTYRGQIWSFATVGAVGSPSPANGAPSVATNAILTWTPSDNAASHQVYFGTDKEALRKADAASPEYKGTRTLGAESYDPGLLTSGSTYYWRVDEVNNVNPSSPWKGPLWSFTTGSFLLVDDFESYNDIDPPDPTSNRIFDKWIDGYGTTTNGALIGNNLPPYAERATVHGGAQSMPYSYDNNLKFSEATMTLSGAAQDWTRQGVANLSLWLRGASGNAAERLYVALNGTAVVYHTNPDAAKISGWTQWAIPLQSFADQGVNLSNVTSISIGFGTKGNTTAAGGTGQVYFDDIRLER